LPIQSDSKCDSYFQKKSSILSKVYSFNKDLELCAGIENGSKDACQGLYF